MSQELFVTFKEKGLDRAEELVGEWAKVEGRDNDGLTPLDLTAEGGHAVVASPPREGGLVNAENKKPPRQIV